MGETTRKEVTMSKKELKAIGIAGGICSIIAALTDYASTRKWKEVHTTAVFGGGIAMLVGVIA